LSTDRRIGVARNERRTLPYRLLACAVLAAAAFAAPGVAQAHGGGSYVAGEATAAPTVDGVVGASEWAGATPYSVVFGSLGNATVRFVYTSTDLYVGAIVQDPTPGMTPGLYAFFDNDHDGIKEVGDDAWLSFRGVGGQDFFYSDVGTAGSSHYNDVGDGTGGNQTVSAGTISFEGDVMFELKHPLCSSDTAHDICVSPGQTLGIDFQYAREAGAPENFVNAPGPDLFDPHNNWADLVLADVVDPTVAVTAPPAGSVLRGTVNVAADVSDNVGVDRVEFKYFGGELPFVPIATDTTPPYEATFDSTKVANTLPRGATVYAFAYDAAGNETGVGNAAMVDNPPSRIVFETDRDGNSEIYSMDPNGFDVTRLTTSPAVDTVPSLSPDGSLIAWQRGGDVWLMNSDGTNQHPLTTDGRSGAPAFSPDGTKIAFQRDPAGDMAITYDIWVMYADGTGQTNLVTAAGNDRGATWSPDGTKLAFDSDRSGSRDIYTMNADGTSQARLAWNSPQIDSDPDWSPDGQKLVFVSGRGGGGTVVSIWSANADGSGGALNVTNATIFDADPAWSPDGTRVVFTRDSGGQTFDLHAADADGTTQFPPRITFANATQRNSFPDWVAPVAAPAETTVTLEPVADTYVRASDPGTAHGSETTFDVYPGASSYCSRGPGPAYGLLRFDLSSLPPGVRVTGARLDLTVDGGFAYDGDPAHYAIRLYDNSWSESVTWSNRPADGIVPGSLGPPLVEPTINGTLLSASQDVLGIGNAFNANCGANSGGPPVRSFSAPLDRPESFESAVVDAIDDGNLSLEIWSQACGAATTVPCQSGGVEKGYYLRYYSREAEAALRPKLIVTYESGVEVTSFSATPLAPKAGIAQVDIDDVPPSVLLAPPRRTTDSTPLGETPLGETPLGETPLGETPLGETPLGETSLGLNDLLVELRTVPLASLPLLREGGWPAFLSNTTLASRAFQTVTLGDVFALGLPQLDGDGPDDITLADLDFSRSSLGDVVTIAYALGNGVTLGELEGAFTNNTLDPDLQRWCTATLTNCADTGVLALGLRGAPLGETPLGETPLGETPLGETPLGETPLGETPLGETPLGETPLGETAFAGTPLGETPLGETDLSRAPLGETPLGETPLGETNLNRAPLGETPLGETPLGETPLGETPLGETLISEIEPQSCTTIFTSPCPPGTDTIDQHLDDLQPNVSVADLVAVLTPAAQARLTLGDLVASLPNRNLFNVAQLLAVLDPPSDYTIAQVAAIFTEASGVTLADLVASLPNPNDFTLDDLLLAVLRAGAQWETIDLTQPALARVATGGGIVSLAADVSVSGTSVVTFSVKLPPGWTAGTSVPWIETVSPGAQISAATTLELVDIEATADGGTRHTYRTQFPIEGDHRFHFDVKPGTTLGPATPSLSVAAVDGTPDVAPPVSVNVQETFEPNNDPATAPMLAPGSLYLSYLTSATDTDFFRVNVPAAAGTRTTIRLSHLPEDYDLVVYGRQGSDQLVEPGAASPLETPVLGDQGAPITHLTEALPAETLDDLTLLTDRPVLGVSAFRTTEDEAVVAVSDGVPGEYIVQVKAYNGATSVEPYMMRVENETPRLAPNCQARFSELEPAFAAPRPGVSLASIPADTDTLFLANGPQLDKAGGQGVLDWFSMANTNLDELRATGHPSALVRLEDDPAVALAYTEWNRQPCSTARANAVVRAITDVVRTIRTARPSVRNLVLLGNDRALPFARLHDLTTIANEADYAATFGRDDDLYGALFEHRVLSDDPYATTDPIPYLQRQLFVPQLAVGRLVETGPQITGALDRFLAFEGELDPVSARTSGYDFLRDGATGVAAAFADIVGAPQPVTAPPLIGNDWKAGTLAGALGADTGLFGMNGHADHSRLQPARDADGDGRFEDTDLFSAANLPATLERSVVFSMGCHSGLSVSDTAVARPDWAQTFAGRGTAAYAGNLGYGYGDTITVAYSEALNVRLAQGLRDGLPIGEALVEAKQGYLANLGLVGVYDEKAMSELALYGLPMWSLAGATPPAPPTTPALPAGVTRLSTDPDPVTGLMVDRYRSQPALNQQPPTGEGTYWTGPSGVQVTHLRPLQPKVEFPVAADAHGVLITGLESPADVTVDPVYARPIVDSSVAEPELPFADVAFPAKIQSLVSQQTRSGPRVSAVLVHGQFFSNDTTDAAGDGNQRLFTRVEVDVLRSSGTDRLAPRFDAIEAVVPPDSGIVSFSVDVVDLPTGSAADVARVLVAFRDQASLPWRFLDLRRSGATARWGGSASVSGNSVEYFMQAVDRWGNVAVSTNKGLLFAGSPPPTPSGTGVSPSLSGTQTAGWFSPDAELNVEAADGIAVSVSIDGVGLTPFTEPITIDTDGLHTVDVRGSNGYEATLLAPVDTLPPTVALDSPGATVPLNGRVPLAFRCGDTASGIASCEATVDGVPRAAGFEVPSAPLGSTHTIRVSATDRVGRPTTQEFQYTVTGRGIVYTSTATGSGDLYVLPVDAGPTTAPTRLTATSFPEIDPVWSPDSRRIAFSSYRDGTWRIYLIDADGTDVTLLPTGSGNALQPAWSPDGGRIAFVSTRTGNFDVWVVNLDGSGLRRLTTDSKYDVAPTWSPESVNRIAWSNGQLDKLDIWTMRPDGTSKARLTSGSDLSAGAAWRSDGTIAFARLAKSGSGFEIWTMTSAGKSQTKIISSARSNLQPTWLQDGGLVFTSNRDDDREFDLFRAFKGTTGWSQERVTGAPGHELSPNG
jgi:Tol biopolymer transport system component